MTTEMCSNCGEKDHTSEMCDTLNSMKIYLSKFNTETEICNEIEDMEILRNYITSETGIINILKYVNYIDNHNFKKIAIEPDVIEKLDIYNLNEIYDESQRSFIYHMYLIPELLKNHMKDSPIDVIDVIKLHPNNVIENIYKIYVTRVRREHYFYESLEDFDINCNYSDALGEVNKRIEFLYRKYALEIISKDYCKII